MSSFLQFYRFSKYAYCYGFNPAGERRFVCHPFVIRKNHSYNQFVWKCNSIDQKSHPYWIWLSYLMKTPSLSLVIIYMGFNIWYLKIDSSIAKQLFKWHVIWMPCVYLNNVVQVVFCSADCLVCQSWNEPFRSNGKGWRDMGLQM